MSVRRGAMPWSRFVLLGVVATLLTAGLVGPAGAAAEKIELCHLPGAVGEQTLAVPEGAVGGHIAHGDAVGSCESLLDTVVERGELWCGVSEGSATGFSVEVGGDWSGLDADLCRAVAAAVLGDADAVVFVPLSSGDRFSAIRDGIVDVLFRTTTDTTKRDGHVDNGGDGVNFGPTYFYDGDSILADPSIPIGELKVCVVAETTTSESLADLASEFGFEVAEFDTGDGALAAFFSEEPGRCNGYAANLSALVSVRQLGIDTAVPGAADWDLVFPVPFSKEPLAPVVRDGDDEWMAVVRWTVFAAFLAEELGVTQSNVDSSFGNGVTTGPALGLDSDWAYNVIKQVGNYAEMYESNLTFLDRGPNASWVDGGLIYAPPIR